MRFFYTLWRLAVTKSPINKLKALAGFFLIRNKAARLVFSDVYMENCYYVKLNSENPVIHDLGANIR